MADERNKRILIAGIGNIFLGDDAFGVEVVRELSRRELPPGVTLVDFGIRSYDLAYALVEHYDLVILVDALSRGEPPGTLSLFEPDLGALEELGRDSPDAHTMHPATVLRMAQALGPVRARVCLLGCEPAVLEDDTGQMSLSPAVAQAVPAAVTWLESLVADLPASKSTTISGQVPLKGVT